MIQKVQYLKKCWSKLTILIWHTLLEVNLITPEHYVILEEMIRKGRTDTILRYNTNASISYKQYDIFDLWKHFDRIELSCSIDYGERAEVMRHGTDWARVEEKLKFRSLDYVVFQSQHSF